MQIRCLQVPGALGLENTSILIFLMTIAWFWLYVEKRPNLKYRRLLISALKIIWAGSSVNSFLKLIKHGLRKLEGVS